MTSRPFTYLLALVLLTACEEDLTLPDNEDAPFTMYGVLSPNLDTQSVRVFPLEDVPTLGSPDPLEVDVVSTDLQTGARRMWSDSVIVDSTGQFGHVFWAPFKAELGTTYRVEAIRRADGATSFAEVRIPPPVSIRLDESDAPHLHVLVEGERIRMTSPEAVYVVGDSLSPVRFDIWYRGDEQKVDDGWRVTFNMIVDYDFIRFQIVCGPYCICKPRLRDLRLQAIVGDAAWDPPGGVFDPNIVSVGRTLSNVENGFGFVGGGYVLDAPLYPSPETVDKACFTHALVDDEPE